MYYGSKLFGLVDNSFLATFGNGRSYNWFAVEHPYGLAPAGWKVPTRTEWETFITTLGGSLVAGGKAKSIRTGLTPGWIDPNTGATNESGFNALGAGFRSNLGGFQQLYNISRIWSSNSSGTDAYNLFISSGGAAMSVGLLSKMFGFSVRCLMIDPTNWQPGDTVTDMDGNVYTTVKIGTQVWMQSNLKTTKFANGTDIPLVTGNTDWAQLTTPGQCTYNNAAISEYTELITL